MISATKDQTVYDHKPDSVQGVRSKTRTDGDTPAEQERCQEAALESASKDNGLCRGVSDYVQLINEDPRTERVVDTEARRRQHQTQHTTRQDDTH